jgi:UDP-hydrolysing UDP-N-acetyl-D-glucosamine 2-epimerase
MPKRIAIITTGRADYGLLVPVLKAATESPDLVPAVYVTGAHLSQRHGRTIDRIEADGWDIAARIETEPSDDTRAPEHAERLMADKTARAVAGFATAFAEHRPDVCVLLGDRFETLGAAVAASASGVPIAHIHGGEISTGALDNQFRYAITALANLHCVATAKARDRLVAMGESPEAVIRPGPRGSTRSRRSSRCRATRSAARLGSRMTLPSCS